MDEPKTSPKPKLNVMKEIKVAKLTLNIGAGKNEDLLKKGLIILN